MSRVTSTVLTDYFINYVFPQYALPWNNFFTDVESTSYGIKNKQRNQTAGAFHSPLDVNTKPFVYLLNHILQWNDLSKQVNQGVVQDTVGTKQFISKDIISQSFYFQYAYTGSFVGLSCSPCTNWFVFLLNLANTNAGYIQNVVVKNVNNKNYSSLIGSITDNDQTITIRNATPIDGPFCHNLLPCDSNTVYKIFGNRIFIAISNDNNTIQGANKLSYSFQFLMQETPSIAEKSGFAVGIL